jgi:hypothetical protein
VLVLLPLAGLAIVARGIAATIEPWFSSCRDLLACRVTALVGALVGILLPARRFLIEYTGDVAAYMSAHEVSRFADLRTEAQARCCRIADYIYRLKGAAGPLYTEVIVLGHSLGSVVAYDVLNELLVREGAHAKAAGIGERTAVFLTFGSPLDKIASIFRSQKPDEALDIREDLAVARQPMLLDAQARPRRWVNLYHATDWIGGAIDYYHLRTPDTCEIAEKVVNIVERGAADPATAHTGYWSRRAFQDLLLWAAAGSGGEPPARQGSAGRRFHPARPR